MELYENKTDTNEKRIGLPCGWDQITTILLFILKLLYTFDSQKWF